MRNGIGLLAVCLSLLSPAVAIANDCWVAGNFVGKSAMSSEEYAFTDNSFKDGMLICFIGEGGTVTGNDLALVRFGESTLIGWGENGLGLEVVNTYQLDRQRNKLFVTQSRIGTATHNSILPDHVSAFVGNVIRAP